MLSLKINYELNYIHICRVGSPILLSANHSSSIFPHYLPGEEEESRVGLFMGMYFLGRNWLKSSLIWFKIVFDRFMFGL